ncbi:hypothetical protein NQD34_008018 [Periophthalmus magnuspinnatus]|nr:hypothetical protein NQD34_008018 [Periophthalmus magnuspinnatus]
MCVISVRRLMNPPKKHITKSFLITATKPSPPAVTPNRATTSVVRSRTPVGIIAPLHGTIAGGLLSIAVPKVPVAVSASHVIIVFTVTTVSIVAPGPSVSSAVTVAIAVSTAIAWAVAAVATTRSAAAIVLHPSFSPASCLSSQLLLGLGLLHFHFVTFDFMELGDCSFRGGIAVAEVNKAETSLLTGLLVRDDLGLLNRAELCEILGQMFTLNMVFEPTDEDFLDVSVNIRVVCILPCNGPLQLNGVSIDDMWLHRHCCVGLLRRREGYKAEAPGTA